MTAIPDGYTHTTHAHTHTHTHNHQLARDLKLKDGLLKQYARELETRGEHVTIMCVGESGVRKK
jgi:hypothetical protein